MSDILKKIIKLLLIVIAIIIPFSLILIGLAYVGQKLYFRYRDSQDEKLKELSED